MTTISATEIEKSLNDYGQQIIVCLDNADWERLFIVLAERQSFLEKILPPTVSPDQRDTLLRLVEKVLTEDLAASVKIQEHQAKLMELHALMGQGTRAIKAYVR